MKKNYYVYIISNYGRTVFYIGVTNDLIRRTYEHKNGLIEGFSRRTNKDKYQFYSISQGSLTELQNQLLISRDVNYINQDLFKIIAEQSIVVNKLIYGLKRIGKYKIPDTKY